MLFLQHCPTLHGGSQLSDEMGNGSVAAIKRLIIIFANQFKVVNKEQHLGWHKNFSLIIQYII